jgi:hypothetical protein
MQGDAVTRGPTMTDLATRTKIKAERRAAEKAGKLADQAPPTTALPVAPPRVIPPSEQAVIRIEAKLVEARAALVVADQELADASFEAIAAAEPDVISSQSLALAAARRVRDLAHEKVSATVAALDVARDRQKQAEAVDRAIAHAEQVAAVRGALTDRARHVAQLQYHLAAAVTAYREILQANAAAVRTGLPLPSGALLSNGELARAISTELYRLSGSPFLRSEVARQPEFPGAVSPFISAIPASIKPLEQAVIEANDHVIRALASIAPPPAPSIRAVPKVSAPVPQVAEPVPTMTAMEIQATHFHPADLSHHLQPNHAPAPAVADVVAAPVDAVTSLLTQTQEI